MTDYQPRADVRTYTGVFLVTLATLMYELLITRIFSATAWYHYAFLAVSVAMLGMTVGAMVVYIKSSWFAGDRLDTALARSAVSFGILSLLAVALHIFAPLIIPASDHVGIFLTSFAVAIPPLIGAFIASGICVSAALTSYRRELGKVYAADLIGAACGCVTLIVALDNTDAITTSVLVAALGTLAGAVFVWKHAARMQVVCLSITAALLAFVCVSGYAAAHQHPLVSFGLSKASLEGKNLFEKWNSFSRIRISGDPERWKVPLHPGLSPHIPRDSSCRSLRLDIDGGADTELLYYNGKPSTVEFVKYDLTNVAHYLRPDGSIFIIGMGGGRDVLSALVMNQKKITAAEINKNILVGTNEVFGDFTGHLDRDPRVHVYNDEARSFIERSHQKFDIIQASLVDTAAASSSGAFSLTENSLYTVEGWRTFLKHLTDGGIVTMHRWYHDTMPAEIYRLTAVAEQALSESGVANPRENIILVRYLPSGPQKIDGVGTILVSNRAFTASDIDRVESLCKSMGWEVALSPRTAADPILAKIADGKNLDELYRSLPFDISPPVDDRPFFFQLAKLQTIFDPRVHAANGNNYVNELGANIVICLLAFVTGASLLTIRVAYKEAKEKSVLKGAFPLLVYFFCIGAGFMLVELSQTQRLSIYLGQPTYALSVVLATLLLSTGIGSFSYQKFGKQRNAPALILLLLSTAVFGGGLPLALNAFASAEMFTRIAISVGTLFPIGFCLGFAFPIGMEISDSRARSLGPALWAVNGVASVFGSVLAVAISMWFGISSAYWCGFASYLVATSCCLLYQRNTVGMEARPVA